MALRGVKWGFFTKTVTAFCVVLAVNFLMPAAYMERVYFQDKQLVADQLGEGTLKSIDKRSSAWFKRLIVDTGTLRECYGLCEREGKDRFDDRGLAAWFANRLDCFWVGVRLTFFRYGEIFVWWPYALAMFIPLIVDSCILRQIRKNQSSSFSPGWFSTFRMLFFGMLALLVLGPMFPFQIPPMLVPVVVGALGAALWGWVAFMPKRV